MKFEELPIDARAAALEAYKQIVIREIGAVEADYAEAQKARCENLAETIAAGFIKMMES